MTTGERIKLARKNAGLTQVALASKLGVTGSMIAQYETGKRNPKYGTIRQIASILHIEWTELVPEEDQEKVITAHVKQAWNNRDTSEDRLSGTGTAISDFKVDGKSIDELSNQFDFSVLNMYSKEHHKSFHDGYWEGWAAKEQELQLTFGYLFSNEEWALVRSFHTLNSEGQQKAIERVEELSEIPKYQKEKEPPQPE